MGIVKARKKIVNYGGSCVHGEKMTMQEMLQRNHWQGLGTDLMWGIIEREESKVIPKF